MKLLRTLAACLLLAGCQAKHDIKIHSKPCLEPFEGYQFKVCKNLLFEVDGKKDFVPQEFVTDLASIPRALWPIWSPTKANTIAPAVIHDYMYLCPNLKSRKEVDDIFYDALVMHGLPKKTALKYWLAVRFFGETHFNATGICDYAIDEPNVTAQKQAIG